MKNFANLAQFRSIWHDPAILVPRGGFSLKFCAKFFPELKDGPRFSAGILIYLVISEKPKPGKKTLTSRIDSDKTETP